jgi:hypothetical protein
MTTAAAPPAGPSRGRIILARILVVVGVVLVAVSLLSNWVKREALDAETFRSTSQELVASEEIRNQLAATTVEQLYANVDVAARLEARLPENVKPLAAPIAGLAREGIERAANQLLERPRVQSLFVSSASLAQAQVVKVLQGDTTRLSTTGGDVVLDLRPVMVRLGDRFGFLGNLEQTLPPDAGRVTLLRSDELDTAQSLTQALKAVADWIWVPALLAWAAALWLVPGRRRKEVRAIAVGLVVAGVALLVVRRVAGSYLVDNLTQSDTVRPAVSSFWEILSDGLAESAWGLVVIGIVATLGAWLTGEGARARSTRRAAAPWLERAGLAWGVFAGVLLLVIWALPLHRFLIAAILVVLASVGFEVARRQALREVEAEGPAEPHARPTLPWTKPAAEPSHVDELERLARLRSEELLSEEEYAAAKGRILPPAGAR